MLVSGLVLIYALFTCYISGSIFQSILFRYSRSRIHVSPVITVLIGLIWIGILLQVFHLFIGIGYESHVLIWVFNLSMFVLLKSSVSISSPSHLRDYAFYTFLFLCALINVSGRAGVGDIADYHLQAIQWIETHKTIPGLGNLRRQLANNSVWFSLQAFFGLHFFGLKSVYILNALLLLLSGIYFSPSRNDRYPLVKIVALVYLMLMGFRKYVGAVTNDYAVTVFTLILLHEFISQPRRSLHWQMLICMLLIAMPTIKLSAIALLIPACYVVYIFLFQQRFTFFIILISLLIYIPWLYTNHIQSGYLVYPLKVTHVLAADWTVPSEILDYERNINIANERAPGIELETALSMKFVEWFPKWLLHLDLFSVTLLASFLVSLMFIVYVRRKINTLQWIVIATVMIGFVIWFSQAPAIRFMFGYIVFTIGLALGLWKTKFSYTYYAIPICSLLLCVNMILFINMHLRQKSLSSILLKPEPYATDILVPHQLPNGTIYTTEPNKQCWDGNIPCSTEIYNGLEYRGKTIADGFRIVKQ
jgi:hypothetical protein